MTAPARAEPLASRPHRDVCLRCRRPKSVCYCAHVPRLPTRTRVVLLQHARERRKPIGTARMAHLALPGSILRTGTDFAGDGVVRSLLAGEGGRGGPPLRLYVLFPGPGAIPVDALPRDQPITLIVLDGTWWQAGKLLKLNPALAALPRVGFAPRRPSEYRIRRQPAAHCLSTVEALAEVLAALEPDGPGFARLLDPFRAMVDRQLACADEVRSGLRPSRHRHPRVRRPRPPPPSLGRRLQALAPHLVCVQGEANAWGRRDPGRQDPEIVHWVAERIATGERFDVVIAPRRPLGPATPAHVELPADVLRAGTDVDAWRARWRDFLRPDDVLVHWGGFYAGLAREDRVAAPATEIDLRAELSRQARRRLGTIDAGLSYLAALATQASEAEGAFSKRIPDNTSAQSGTVGGRAGRRLAGLVALVENLCQERTPMR